MFLLHCKGNSLLLKLGTFIYFVTMLSQDGTNHTYAVAQEMQLVAQNFDVSNLA
jgi:hypothetical protein